MKKLTLILSTFIMLAGLTACGQKTTISENSAASQTDISAAASPALQQTASGQNLTDTASLSYHTITVNSSEKISIIPDIAEVTYSVHTKDSEAAGCQQKNQESVSQVVELLKGLGISETSIQTSDYYMNPVYNYSGSTPKLTGYEAVTTLTVSDLPIDDLDNILSQSVSTGINTIQSITYQASEYDKSYQEALTRAVASANEKAQVLASASGACVGSIISIQETSGYSQARYTDYARSNQYNSFAKLEALEDTAGIMPGEIQVEAGIIAEYQLIP